MSGLGEALLTSWHQSEWLTEAQKQLTGVKTKHFKQTFSLRQGIIFPLRRLKQTFNEIEFWSQDNDGIIVFVLC